MAKNTSVLKRLKANLKQNGLVKKDNPFEMKVTRQKHQVMGRIVKGAIGKPSVSRKKGQQQRSQTLLKEYKTKDRLSQFQDRRFGEGDVTMSVEDKMLERFTKEKMRRSERGGKFNLEDNEDLFGGDDMLGDVDFTHSGQKISTLNDSELRRSGNLSQDEDGIDKNVVNEHHFGGFDEETEGKKTFKDVMSEVIAKSKHFKQERQREKAENEDLRLELDDELGDVRNVLLAASQTKLKIADEKPAAEDYDMFVKELAYERKAKPTDRLKTEEEVAKEEAQRLVELEAARLQRMNGGQAEDSRNQGADSLDANYLLNEDAYDQLEQQQLTQKRRQGESKALVYGEGQLLNPEDLTFGRGAQSYSSEEDSGSEQESMSGSDSDQDSEASSQISALESTEVACVQDEIDEYEQAEQEEELPFTFEFPQKYQDLLVLFAGRTLEQQEQIVARLQTLYHPSLHADNSEKMKSLLKLLLQHFELGWKFTSDANKVPYADQLTLCMETTDIQEFSTSYKSTTQKLGLKYPMVMAEVFRGRLSTFQKNFVKRLGTQQQIVKQYEFELVRFMVELYSMSDFNHTIGTPTQLLLGQWLSGLCQSVNHGMFRNAKLLKCNIAVGLLVANLFLDCQSQAKRYSPELVNFMYTCLSCFKDQQTTSMLFGQVSSLSKQLMGQDVKLNQQVNKLFERASDMYASKIQAVVRPGVSTGSADQLDDFNLSEVYVKTPLVQGWPFEEVFGQFRQLLDDPSHYDRLRGLIKITRKQNCTKVGADIYRLPLQLHKQKTTQQKTLTPKFQERFNLDRFYDPDPQRSEAKKVKALHKKELKGAIKELRKDAAFLANIQLQEIKAADSKYNKNIKRVYGMIGNEVGKDKEEAKKQRK